MKRISINTIIKHQSFQTLMILVVNIFLNFILNIILARSLKAEGFGIYAYGTVLLSTLSIFSTFGFRELLIRDTAIYVQQKSWGLLHGIIDFSHKSVFWFSILTSLLTILFLGLTKNPLQKFPSISIIVALLLPFLSIRTLQVSILQGFKKTPLSLLPEKIVQPLLLLFALFLFSFLSISFSIFVVMIFYGISSVISLLITKINLRQNLSSEVLLSSKQFQKKNWIMTSIPLMLLSGVSLLLSQIDIFMLGFMKQSEDVGIYVVATKIATLILFLLSANNLVLRPQIAETFASGNIGHLKKIFRKNSLWVFLLSLPIIATIFIFAQDILSLFGEEFTAGRSTLLVICLGQLVNVLAGPVNLTLNMTHNHNFTLISTIISLFANITGNYLLIPSLGGLGAAWATTLTLIAWNLVSWFFVNYKLLK